MMTPLCISLKLWYVTFCQTYLQVLWLLTQRHRLLSCWQVLREIFLACSILLPALSRYFFNAALTVIASSWFDFHCYLSALLPRDLAYLFSDSLPLLAVVNSMSVILKVACAVLLPVLGLMANLKKIRDVEGTCCVEATIDNNWC